MGSLVGSGSCLCVRFGSALRFCSVARLQRYCSAGGRSLSGRTSASQSVFAAGHAKRTAEFLKKKSGTERQQNGTGKVPVKGPSETGEVPERPLSVSEWRNLKASSCRPERFEVRMMELILASESDISIAKSLLNFAADEHGTLSYELLLKFLALCVAGGHYAEVLDAYDIMRSCFRTLDTGAYSLFIKGLCRTERWKETLILLELIKKVITPSPRNYGDAITGAFLHGDRSTAWHLYWELIDQRLTPNQDTWCSLFQSAVRQREHANDLRSVLTFMRENQIYPQHQLVQDIQTWCESLPDEQWRGQFSTVDLRGVCRSCGAELESIQLTDEEYTQLKHRVMTDVIEGKDIFNKTTPAELESFKSFVSKRPAFDVIVDGLNVANLSPKCTKSGTLLAVVSELEQQGLRNILVLGRKHMLQPSRNWNQQHMIQIKHKAHCFFTDNISEDDPFLLYAALHSGNHCKFVSRDLMRDHKACLPDNVTRRLFFKWQRGHQLVISSYVPGKRVRFQKTTTFDTIVQSTRNSWHIPYDEAGAERSTYEVPQNWLCLTKAPIN